MGGHIDFNMELSLVLVAVMDNMVQVYNYRVWSKIP